MSLLLILLLGLTAACKKETNEPVEDTYLVDYSLNHFYPLETLQAFLAGTVEEYPEAAGLLENALYGIQVYIIEYKTHYRDSLVTASGLVCLPMADGTFPVISFQNGTNTKHDDAPSKAPFNESFLLLETMASNGYIVLIPDYVGFGSSEDIIHPYYHKASSNNAVIDMLLAFNEMEQKPDILPGKSDHTYLMGYSQGGWATLAAVEEIENGYHPGMSITAASCGAGAYYLITMTDYVLGQETYPGPVYLPYFIYSQQTLGMLTDPLDKYFKLPYAGKIPVLFDGSYSNDEVNAELTDQIADLVTDALRLNFETGQDFSKLRERLAENSIIAWNTDTKIHLYHGTADQNVPPEQSQSLYQNFMIAGADPYTVEYFGLFDKDHGSGVMPWGIATINWLNGLENK